ncbi:MAG TPA: DUF3618 domain-containing protein [Polyangiaceae bacterium]|nr:DUF3618 domain-containing protein [Polyangiaceae bacterium]
MTQPKKPTWGLDRPPGENEVAGIEAEIDQTRSEISDDLRTLGEKLNPERLKGDAKEVMREAKQVAVETLKEAGTVATNTFREVKDSAMETVHEKVDDLRSSVRHAGDETRAFLSENAIPLALMGIGAAWFVSKRRARAEDYGSYGRRYYPERMAGSGRSGPDVERPSLTDRMGGRVHDVAERAGEKLEDVKGRVRGFAEREAEQVRHLAEDAGRRVSEGTAQARDFVSRELHEAREVSRRMTEENPLVVGLAAVAAGIGVGLLLPQTQPERKLLGTTRDEWVGEAKQALSDVTQTVKETAREVKSTLSGSA